MLLLQKLINRILNWWHSYNWLVDDELRPPTPDDIGDGWAGRQWWFRDSKGDR